MIKYSIILSMAVGFLTIGCSPDNNYKPSVYISTFEENEEPRPGLGDIRIKLPPKPPSPVFTLRRNKGKTLYCKSLINYFGRTKSDIQTTRIDAIIDKFGKPIKINVVNSWSEQVISRENKKKIEEKLKRIIGSWRYYPYATGKICYSINLFGEVFGVDTSSLVKKSEEVVISNGSDLYKADF